MREGSLSVRNEVLFLSEFQAPRTSYEHKELDVWKALLSEEKPEELLEQLSLVNRLYAEAAATGSRNVLREALEIDPALTGIDLLYAEGIVADMLENQKEKYPRFFRE